MKILLTGASGLIGSALAPFLIRQGHQVVKLRRMAGAEASSSPSWDPESGKIALGSEGPFEALIHLAGENIAQRWTPAAKARIRNTRVKSTRVLSESLTRLPQAPKIFVCASATGYYGDRGEQVLDEQSGQGSSFLADVCQDWEAATQPVALHGI